MLKLVFVFKYPTHGGGQPIFSLNVANILNFVKNVALVHEGRCVKRISDNHTSSPTRGSNRCDIEIEGDMMHASNSSARI